MESIAAGIPILEAAVRLDQIGVVKVRRVESVVERCGSYPVQDHVPHWHHIHITDQQSITEMIVPPPLKQESLQLLWIVDPSLAFQDVLQRNPFGRKLLGLVGQELGQ